MVLAQLKQNAIAVQAFNQEAAMGQHMEDCRQDVVDLQRFLHLSNLCKLAVVNGRLEAKDGMSGFPSALALPTTSWNSRTPL